MDFGLNVTTWTCEKCPLDYECSERAFSRAWVKSQTSEMHCRKILWSHLTISSKHNATSAEDIFHISSTWPLAVEEKPLWHRVDERFQGDEDIPAPCEGGMSTEELQAAQRLLGDESDQVTTRQLAGAVSDDIHKVVKDAVAAALAGSQLALRVGSGGGISTGNLEVMKGALEAAKRAERSMEHAADWFEKGTVAFRAEVQTISDARRTLEEAVNTATGGGAAASASSFFGRSSASSRSKRPRSPEVPIRYKGGDGGKLARKGGKGGGAWHE